MIRDNKTFKLIVLFLLFLSFAVTYSEPLWDIDLWWHLATGKYIVEHKRLLTDDPFAYTSGQNLTDRALVIMNGYWLSQVIFYCAYAVFGAYGLIAARVLLLLSILFAIYFIGRRMGATYPGLILVLVLAGLISLYFTGERPQLFSFLLAPIVFYQLNYIKGRQEISDIKPKYIILLPLTMLLWANLHGGFIIGTALIAVFIVSEAAGLFLRKGADYKTSLVKFAVLGLAIAVTFLNPNIYKPYVEAVKLYGSVREQMISEYVSPVTMLMQYKQFLFPYWIYILLILAVAAILFKKIDRTHLVIMVFLTALSVSSFRYIPFLIYTTAPVTALYLSNMTEGRIIWNKAIRALAGVAAIMALMVAVKGFNKSLGQTLKHEIRACGFPEAAASFVLENHPSGNLFNNFNWGGYLIWRLYPANLVFIDGRTLRLEALMDYTRALWNEPDARNIFDHYGINIVIIPGLSPFTGELYELVNILKNDEQWHLVFTDDTAMVFVRGNENQDIIRKYSLPKTEAYTHVIKEVEFKLISGFQSPHLWLALEKAFREKGFIREAMQAHENALRAQGMH